MNATKLTLDAAMTIVHDDPAYPEKNSVRESVESMRWAWELADADTFEPEVQEAYRLVLGATADEIENALTARGE